MIHAPSNVEDRVPPMTPRLALRVALFGMFAFAMFAVIFFRLWFLQVLSSTHYLAQASLNSDRPLTIAAQRGEVLDRNGNPLVESTSVPTVEISPGSLPTPITIEWLEADQDRSPQDDVTVYRRLASLLRIPDGQVACQVPGEKPPPKGTYGTFRMSAIACTVAQKIAVAPYENAAIEPNVAADIEYYLRERQINYQGVVVQSDWVRQYPLGDLAAQLFGTVGPLSCPNKESSATCETDWQHFKGIPAADEVGQSGLEYEYNSVLQGTDGKQVVRVNAAGEFQGYGTTTPPVTGLNLQLSIDPKLQQVGESALQTSITTNGGSGGAFVAMDPDNGQILAMGSNPTFKPSIFTKPISQAEWNSLTDPASGYPLLNRAVQAAGPTGSTFKVITATAALESGDWSLAQTYDDTGRWCFPNTTPPECKHNAGGVANGSLDLVGAIKVSDDVFFYNLGYLMNSPASAGGPLQQWAHAFGIGQNTGVDLPDAATGTRPSPEWRASQNALEEKCMAAHHYDNEQCQYTIWPIEPWTSGDNVNMAVGQGDVQVSPLQLAVVYAALANGGTIVTPHIAEDVQYPDGTIEEKIDPPNRGHLNIDPTYLQAILTGLREAASESGGTSADVMGSFTEPVYGKTGTAQYLTSTQAETDYAWYACFVPAEVDGTQITTKPIVVVVWVEKGGFGDVAAAPVARQILSQWFLGTPGPYTSGSSKTL